MAIGTVPILIAGLCIKLFWPGYATSPLRSVPAIAVVSIVMALLLGLAERLGPRLKQLTQVEGRDGLVVGLAQVLALIPGVSRSGSTLTASLFDGWKRADAARFSFLLGIPAITDRRIGGIEGRLFRAQRGGCFACFCGDLFCRSGVMAGHRLAD